MMICTTYPLRCPYSNRADFGEMFHPQQVVVDVRAPQPHLEYTAGEILSEVPHNRRPLCKNNKYVLTLFHNLLQDMQPRDDPGRCN